MTSLFSPTVRGPKEHLMSSKAQRIIDGPGHTGNIAELTACITGLRTEGHDPAGTAPDRMFPAQRPVDDAAPVRGRMLRKRDLRPVRALQVGKDHPHAFMINPADGTGVLVHVGIGTGRLGGSGFAVHETEGEETRADRKAITFNPGAIRGRGVSAACPRVILHSAPGSAQPPVATGTITIGPPLSGWAAS
jgi:hypothetical protein